jgi:hypothetical protein
LNNMQRDAKPTNNEPIDRDVVADIARKVIARLVAGSDAPDTPTVDDRVVSIGTLQQLPRSGKRISIRPDAIITPAAADEARDRGITISRTNDTPGQPHTREAAAITDPARPERATAVCRQLDRRGIGTSSARIVLSDTPASEVWQQCSAQGERAVMISAVHDVQRFADELQPTLWVLDMNRLNLVAAVNVIATITRIGSLPR